MDSDGAYSENDDAGELYQPYGWRLDLDPKKYGDISADVLKYGDAAEQGAFRAEYPLPPPVKKARRTHLTKKGAAAGGGGDPQKPQKQAPPANPEARKRVDSIKSVIQSWKTPTATPRPNKRKNVGSQPPAKRRKTSPQPTSQIKPELTANFPAVRKLTAATKQAQISIADSSFQRLVETRTARREYVVDLTNADSFEATRNSPSSPQALNVLAPRLVKHKDKSLIASNGHRPCSVVVTPTGPTLQVGSNGLARFGNHDSFFVAPDSSDDGIRVHPAAFTTYDRNQETKLIGGARVLHPGLKQPSYDGRSNELPSGYALTSSDVLYLDGNLFKQGNEKTQQSMPSIAEKVWTLAKKPVAAKELVQLTEYLTPILAAPADNNVSKAPELLGMTQSFTDLNDDVLYSEAGSDNTLKHLGNGLPEKDQAILETNQKQAAENPDLKKAPTVDVSIDETALVWAPRPQVTADKVTVPPLHLVVKPTVRHELLHGTIADMDQIVFQPAPGLIGGDVEKAASLAAKMNKIREDPAHIGLLDVWVPSYLCQGTIVLTLDPAILPIWTALEKERGNRFSSCHNSARRTQ